MSKNKHYDKSQGPASATIGAQEKVQQLANVTLEAGSLTR
jgi:hypothetical protein